MKVPVQFVCQCLKFGVVSVYTHTRQTMCCSELLIRPPSYLLNYNFCWTEKLCPAGSAVLKHKALFLPVQYSVVEEFVA